MSDAGLTGNDIHKVLLVGGSSRIPAVQEAVKKLHRQGSASRASTPTSASPWAQPFRRAC